MRAILGATFAIAIAASGAAAQNEGALRAAFEGRTVVVRIDMPATSEGVEVYPLDATPVDFRQVAQRMKDNGTAIRMGERAMVTKVVIKRNSHIEFQLGGGGYGTVGDWTGDGSSVRNVQASETREEKLLKERIKQAKDKGEKKRLQKELDGIRSERERENARAAADAQQANMARETMVRSRRIESGSRFNIRYREGIPAEGLTPDGVMRALAQYVDFGGGATASVAGAGPLPLASLGATSGAPSTGGGGTAGVTTGVTALRKGQSLAEVEALLGVAQSSVDVKDGTMTVVKRTYVRDGTRVVASFVSGVLVDFAITPL